jgi:hypothetical protein
MKKIIFLLLLSTGIFISCQNSNGKISTDVVKSSSSASSNENTGDLPVIQFEETSHDFGKIIQGEKVSYTFKFKNTGNSDLLISRVSTSCGCTVGEYPKEPVGPGKSGTIEVTFNSHNKKGFQNKTVTVLANTEPNATTLHIKSVVEVPETK